MSLRKFRLRYVVLITAVFSAVSIPLILYFVQDQQTTTGAIRISPIVNPILFESELDKLPSYDLYKNTQAATIGGSNVLNRVADDLAARNLPIFGETNDPLPVLREMVDTGKIEVVPDENTELINLTMTTPNPSQAETIIDSLLTSYMAWIESEESTGGTNKLDALDKKKRMLKEDIDSKKREINKLVNEFGSSGNNPRQEMMLRVVAQLQEALIDITMKRIGLEAKVQLMENDTSRPLDKAQKLNPYIESDPVLNALAEEIAAQEVLVAKAKIELSENHPDLLLQKEILGALNKRLSELQAERQEELVARHQAELAQAKKTALTQAKAELAQTVEYENKLREKLKEQDTDTIDIGRTQLNIDDHKEELAQTKALYNQVVKRIDEIEFEQDRPARISIASRATSVTAKGRKLQMIIGSVIAGFLLGVLAALTKRKKTTATFPKDRPA